MTSQSATFTASSVVNSDEARPSGRSARWPRLLRDLADVVGEAHALALARRFGGAPYYLPQSPTGGHPFGEVLPPEVFAALCASWLGGTYLTIPRGPARKSLYPCILRMRAEGRSQRAIALALGVTVSYVGKVCRRSLRSRADASGASLPSPSAPSASCPVRQGFLPGLPR